MVKNPLANADDVRDVGLVPGSGRSPGEGNNTHSSILAWGIPWTEESGGLQSMGSQSRKRLKQLSMSTCESNIQPGSCSHCYKCFSLILQFLIEMKI